MACDSLSGTDYFLMGHQNHINIEMQNCCSVAASAGTCRYSVARWRELARAIQHEQVSLIQCKWEWGWGHAGCECSVGS